MSKTVGMKAFFTYFGGKWRVAGRYPSPKHKTVVEPFAGAAGYSLRYYQRDVILIDKFETIVGLWQYLTRVSAAEIRALPLVRPGQSVDDFPDIPQEAKWLIGFWLNVATSAPCRSPARWMRDEVALKGDSHSYWGPRVRDRIASQVDKIRHWRVIHGSYADAPDLEATWYVDPPYHASGKHYVHSEVDYEHLAQWCRDRRGQTIVCEQAGASWLPFWPLNGGAIQALGGSRGKKRSSEVIWTNALG
jgi:hypothetical protein